MKVHIWLRKKAGMSDEEFRDYWLATHAPIAGEGYEHLRGYQVHLVTKVPDGQERPYDGVAELTWDDRDGFKADMASDVAAKSTEDLKNFTDGFGLLFVEEHAIK
ncbi:MAG TPA: EthD domain-containing protein [Actinomycetota bacterium]|nr:EthD domain-containing protein [Actinomycetota bacterium]